MELTRIHYCGAELTARKGIVMPHYQWDWGKDTY